MVAVATDGTATGTIGGSSTVQQTWSVSGSTLTIAETDACVGVQGTYTLAFDSTCNKTKLTRISDTCSQRGDCVDGLNVTRQ